MIPKNRFGATMLPLFRNSEPGTMKLDVMLAVVFMAALLLMAGWMSFNPEVWQAWPFMQMLQGTNLMLLAPEAIIMVVILVSVLHLSFAANQSERKDTWWLATVGSAIALICLVLHFVLIYPQGTDYVKLSLGEKLLASLRFEFLASGEWLSRSVSFMPTRELPMFQADLFSLVVRTLLVFGTLLVLLFTRTFIDKKSEVPGEFYVILLSALFGGMLLSGASDLIMVFVCLETLSISSYILVAYLRGNVLSAEAGLKYLLYGGMATAILLFGLSILYGLAGSTSFAELSFALARVPQDQLMLVTIMTVMIVGGIGFKLSAAPFHMWAPDVYEGAPTPVVAFLSVISKIAGFALALRLFTTLFGGLPGWFGLLAVLSVLSMVIGNVVALTQRNIKRLMAYSTVAHVGYLLLGLVVLTPAGLSSLLYYLTTYLFMNLGAFAVITTFENMTGREDIAAYAGLVRKRPGLALMFTIMLLSLAGIPITAGFFGKFFLFQAVAEAGSQHLWLVIVALLTSTISLYYYLNIVRLMVIAEPSDAVAAMPDKEPEAAGAWSVRPALVTMVICMVGTLFLGINAQPALTLSRQAVTEMAKGTYYAMHQPAALSLSQVAQPRQ